MDPEQNMLEKGAQQPTAALVAPLELVIMCLRSCCFRAAIDGKKQPISAAHGREYGKHVGTAEEIKEARRVAYQQKRRDREAKKVRSQALSDIVTR